MLQEVETELTRAFVVVSCAVPRPRNLLMMQVLILWSAVPAIYTGRWSGELVGVPSGTLGEPTAHAPLLGNGYMGVTASSQRSPVPAGNGTSVDLWINSNANWDCQSSGKDAPPALCS